MAQNPLSIESGSATLWPLRTARSRIHWQLSISHADAHPVHWRTFFHHTTQFNRCIHSFIHSSHFCPLPPSLLLTPKSFSITHFAPDSLLPNDMRPQNDLSLSLSLSFLLNGLRKRTKRESILASLTAKNTRTQT